MDKREVASRKRSHASERSACCGLTGEKLIRVMAKQGTTHQRQKMSTKLRGSNGVDEMVFTSSEVRVTKIELLPQIVDILASTHGRRREERNESDPGSQPCGKKAISGSIFGT